LLIMNSTEKKPTTWLDVGTLFSFMILFGVFIGLGIILGIKLFYNF